MKVTVISQIEKLLEIDDIVKITLPTVEGSIQILTDHQNLLTTVDTGDIVIENKDGVILNVLISGGFADISNNKILILADQADLPDHLVKEEINNAIQRAEQNISSSSLQPSELIALERTLRYEKFKQKYIS